MPVRKLPDSITLLVKGSGQTLFGLNFVRKAVVLDAGEADKTRLLDLRKQKNQLRLPVSSGIEILKVVQPQKLYIEIDRRVQRKLPVYIQSRVETEPGYLIVREKVTPDSIHVTGPEKLLNKINAIPTDSILAVGTRYPVSRKVRFISPYPGVVRVRPEKGMVSIVVEPIVERTLYDVPIQLVNIPADLIGVAEPKSVSVRVKGGETRISNLSVNEITVLFDYKLSFRNGTMDYPMQIITPPDVTWLEVSPKRFELQLIRKDETF